MNCLQQLWSCQDASKEWELSPHYIKNLCKAGKVKAVQIGKTWIIDKNQPNPRKERDYV